MSTNGSSADLGRLFAPMLGELEDHQTRLVQRQAELARELDAVNTDIDRIEAAKKALMGGDEQPRRGRPRRRDSALTHNQERDQRREQVLAWAREHGAPFTGATVAAALGLPQNGAGPLLAGMARNGLLDAGDDGGQRVYTVTP